ncbi:hypothetical protein LTS08_004690 [Lithohypha guttulata]|nr:hypothetical protein LTS08_004690 [Lithohypha guttulata]
MNDTDDEDNTFSLAENVLDAAIHPLSSVNPPPIDLPDLLDSLIDSESKLVGKIELCDQLADGLARRILHIRNKLERLQRRYPEWRSKVNPYADGVPRKNKSKMQVAFEQQEVVFSRMLMQLNFLHFCLFTRFLGERHSHPGIEIANSRHLHCVDGCEWYLLHGPYEWSEQPYGKLWQAEMNHTNWDWVAVRKHINDLIENSRAKASDNVDLLHSHLLKFVPFWFWVEDYESWTLQAKISARADEQGRKLERITTVVRYQKSTGQLEQELERARTVVQQKKEQTGEECTTPTIDDIDPFGVQDLHPHIVFDGKVFIREWAEGAEAKVIDSWLDYWGFQQWLRQMQPTRP